MRQRYGIGTPRGLQDLAAARAALSRHAGSAILRSFYFHIGLFGAILGFSGRRIRLGPQIPPCFGAGASFSPGALEPPLLPRVGKSPSGKYGLCFQNAENHRNAVILASQHFITISQSALCHS